MTCIVSIFNGLMDAIDGWAANVLTATASDNEARTGKDADKSS